MSVNEDNQVLRILRSFGDINLEQFDCRLKLQKLGYLAQAFGAKGDFPYSWYLRGPYSTSLTSTLFMGVEVDAFKSNVTLTKEEVGIVKKMKELLGSDIDDTRILELYASVWYLMPNRELTKKDVDGIISVMNELKPTFTSDEVKGAIGRISKFKK